MEAITSSSYNMIDLNLLQIKLKEKLTGKTFLIVLDDVWSEPLDDDKWNTLLQPFQYENNGSKILLTTRNEKVSSMMPPIQTYELRSLSAEDCWLVFLKHSFLSTECGEYAALESTGKEIVKKCKGLPLAAKTLGSLLRSKYDIRDWNDVLKSEIWEFSEDKSKIIPALKISYYYLPSHLKRCFVYCSLFSKDHRFKKGELILLWMAEDFLQPMKRKTLEEIGCEYFDELIARSFFQHDKTTPGDRCFVMHDLMHDLAILCAGEFYFRLERLGSAIEIVGKTRHLSSWGIGFDFSSNPLIAKHMRTVVCWFLGESDMELISQLKFLRVLSCQSLILLDSLPDSIGELIHLRYLNLSNTCIVTLPESLSKLYNLQTLKLRNCTKLKMLPSGMQDLLNLRHLDIRCTRGDFLLTLLEEMPKGLLKEMPKGMSKLTHLHFLSDYIVGEHEENKIRELGALGNLHGSLSISNLEIVTNGYEASEARMIAKEFIDHLMLKWSPNSNVADSQMEGGILDILDKLEPHSNLKELSIDGYRGTIFPDWLGRSTYKNMTNMTLKGCGNCRKLPSLGQLPSLKHLEISQFDRLQCIGAEFYKSGESCSEIAFRSLETLIFNRLDCWQEWRSLEFDDAFLQLKQLTINRCHMLIGDLPNHLPALEKLTIGLRCEQLACSLPRAPAMLELTIQSKNELRMEELPLSVSSLSIQGNQLVEFVIEAMTHTQPTRLRQLSISFCDSVISFPGDCMPSSLQSLRISLCNSLTSFPLNAFPNLTDLKISRCENMRSLVGVSEPPEAAISSLRSLEIESCPEINSFPEGVLLPNLRELKITRCKKLVSCLASMDLRSHGLTHLSIGFGSEKSFPKEGWLPTSLESLFLWHFPSLETLDCSGLSHLTSLQSLSIWFCDKLENITGERMPASLTHLGIHLCPLLGGRCRVKDPQIWPKISYIPYIAVDGRDFMT